MRLALVILALVVGLCACGYDTGLRVSERYSGIGVEIFGNESEERDLERALNDQMTRAVRDLTDAPIENPTRAEVVIRGTIKDYHRRRGVRSSDNELLETGLYMLVEATLVDRRSGRALGPPRPAAKWVGYVLDDRDNEARARDRLMRYIADQLVLDLFAPVN